MSTELQVCRRILANLSGAATIGVASQLFVAWSIRDPFAAPLSGVVRVVGALSGITAANAAIWVRRWGLRPDEWLTEAGAEIVGLADAPPTDRSKILGPPLAWRAWRLGLVSAACQILSATPALLNAALGGSALDIWPYAALGGCAVALCRPTRAEFDALDRRLHALCEAPRAPKTGH